MPVLNVQRLAYVCGCGVGQKNDGSGEWDEKTFLEIPEGTEAKCPNPAHGEWKKYADENDPATGKPRIDRSKIEERAFGKLPWKSGGSIGVGASPVPGDQSTVAPTSTPTSSPAAPPAVDVQ